MSQKRQIFKLKFLRKLLTTENSCVSLVSCTRLLAIPPFYLYDMKEGILYILNSFLKKYDRILDGILIGYQNVKILMDENTGIIPMGAAETEVNVSVEFYIFQPKIGSCLEGTINKISNNHIGCLVHQYFNATILKPEDVEYEDWICKDFSVDDKIIFKVKDLDFTTLLPYIEGVVDSKDCLFRVESKKTENCDLVNNVNCTNSVGSEGSGDESKSRTKGNEKLIEKNNRNMKETNTDMEGITADNSIEGSHTEKKKKKKKKKHDIDNEEEALNNANKQDFKINEAQDIHDLPSVDDREEHDSRPVEIDETDRKREKKKKKKKEKEREEVCQVGSVTKVDECLVQKVKEEDYNVFYSTQLDPSEGAEKMAISFCSPIQPIEKHKNKKDKKKDLGESSLATTSIFRSADDGKEREDKVDGEEEKRNKKRKRKKEDESGSEDERPEKRFRNGSMYDLDSPSPKKEMYLEKSLFSDSEKSQISSPEKREKKSIRQEESSPDKELCEGFSEKKSKRKELWKGSPEKRTSRVEGTSSGKQPEEAQKNLIDEFLKEEIRKIKNEYGVDRIEAELSPDKTKRNEGKTEKKQKVSQEKKGERSIDAEEDSKDKVQNRTQVEKMKRKSEGKEELNDTKSRKKKKKKEDKTKQEKTAEGAKDWKSMPSPSKNQKSISEKDPEGDRTSENPKPSTSQDKSKGFRSDGILSEERTEDSKEESNAKKQKNELFIQSLLDKLPSRRSSHSQSSDKERSDKEKSKKEKGKRQSGEQILLNSTHAEDASLEKQRNGERESIIGGLSKRTKERPSTSKSEEGTSSQEGDTKDRKKKQSLIDSFFKEGTNGVKSRREEDKSKSLYDWLIRNARSAVDANSEVFENAVPPVVEETKSEKKKAKKVKEKAAVKDEGKNKGKKRKMDEANETPECPPPKKMKEDKSKGKEKVQNSIDKYCGKEKSTKSESEMTKEKEEKKCSNEKSDTGEGDASLVNKLLEDAIKALKMPEESNQGKKKKKKRKKEKE